MKQITLTILIAGFIFVTNSCCTKMDCVGSHELYEIQFFNFAESDLDTILIISFTQNSNFSSIIDSSWTRATDHGPFASASLENRINIDHDYKIILLSTGQVYTLTNFTTDVTGCNDCFPYRPQEDYYTKLKTYEVNGQSESGSLIKITQ